MINVDLDANQIALLVSDKIIELSSNVAVELHDNKILLNDDGNICCALELNIVFEERGIDMTHVSKRLQALICKHLNLKPIQVIYTVDNNDEHEFIIRFAPGKERKIYVCESRRAVLNTRDQFDCELDILTNAPSIGLYRQLGNSPYYFRWLEDFFTGC